MEAGKHILVVEDSPAVREVLRLRLGAADYRVACAGNGREALDHLRLGPPPFVILLDPSNDGSSDRLVRTPGIPLAVTGVIPTRRGVFSMAKGA